MPACSRTSRSLPTTSAATAGRCRGRCRTATVLFGEEWIDRLVRPVVHEFTGRSADRLADALVEAGSRRKARRRAAELTPGMVSAAELYEALLGERRAAAVRQTVFVRRRGRGGGGGMVAAKLERDGQGGFAVSVRPHEQTAADLAELAEQIEALVAAETAAAAGVRFGRRLVGSLTPEEAREADRAWLEGYVGAMARASGLEWDRWRCAATADVLRSQPDGWERAVVRAVGGRGADPRRHLARSRSGCPAGNRRRSGFLGGARHRRRAPRVVLPLREDRSTAERREGPSPGDTPIAAASSSRKASAQAAPDAGLLPPDPAGDGRAPRFGRALGRAVHSMVAPRRLIHAPGLSLRSPQRAGVVGAFPPVPTQSIVTTAHPAAIASSAGSAGIRRRPWARPSSVSRRPAPRPGRLSPASIPAFSRGPFSRSASLRHDAGLGADVPPARGCRGAATRPARPRLHRSPADAAGRDPTKAPSPRGYSRPCSRASCAAAPRRARSRSP